MKVNIALWQPRELVSYRQFLRPAQRSQAHCSALIVLHSALRDQECVSPLAGFFDQDTHLRMGGFEVDGEIVVEEAFAGGGADGGDDHLLAGLFELSCISFLLQELHDMIDLRGVGDQQHVYLPGDDGNEYRMKRSDVLR